MGDAIDELTNWSEMSEGYEVEVEVHGYKSSTILWRCRYDQTGIFGFMDEPDEDGDYLYTSATFHPWHTVRRVSFDAPGKVIKPMRQRYGRWE